MNENVTEVVAVLADYQKYFSTRTDMDNYTLRDVMGSLMEELLAIADKAKVQFCWAQFRYYLHVIKLKQIKIKTYEIKINKNSKSRIKRN